MFVRIDWKSLPMTKALAYYENQKFTDKKSFITLGQFNKDFMHGRKAQWARPYMLGNPFSTVHAKPS